MNKMILAAVATGAIFALASCRSAKPVPASYASVQMESTCLGSDPDGSQVIRCWGRGSSKSQAIEAAMKNAVNDVIFKGIKEGSGCNQRPLVSEVNGRRRYANYFDAFFANGGEYRKFVREESKKNDSRIKAENFSGQAYSVVVVVDRVALRKQLIDDGVIPADTRN